MKPEIKVILEKLNNLGYEAYVVGGFVRDYLVGKTSFDVDICTSALPNELTKIFNIPSNNFGGINFGKDNLNITITSFRKDTNYHKGYPQEVIYGVDLREDLKRRDFTINTILLDKEGNILSLLGGKEDLDKKIIRMVGEPNMRIKEDPLRIIRTLRFASVLNFEIDDTLGKAIKENTGLINEINKGKIEKEIAKITDKKALEKFYNFMVKFNLQSLKIRL